MTVVTNQADSPLSAIQEAMSWGGLSTDKIETANMIGEIILLSCSSHDSFANRFSCFFTRKTGEIRDTIYADNSSMSETVIMDADIAFKKKVKTDLFTYAFIT